jgi:hypothetical protein
MILCLFVGVYVALEHPAGSRSWSLRETISLMNHPMLKLLRVDWCMYSTENQANKKLTKLLSSAPWMSAVCSCCDRSHRHVMAQDRVSPQAGPQAR